MPEKIIVVDTEEKMRKDYIDYAMSVIVDRALPDVRDGLKPVHRRILYAMHELGLLPEKGYRKCARVVGDVLGKYHPHGDQAVYDALVRMAQDFSMRYTLVNGHGNFGSVDGDSPASMRYTECKQDKIFKEMLRDIKKDTIKFVPNFDGEELEPSVLPVKFPNLLVNGSEGIAVGMATKIPSHNLGEVIDGTVCMIDNPECNIDDVLEYLKAPDFPTGGNIINASEMRNIYATGTGKVVLRSVHHIEVEDKRTNIVVTEIPYQVNKAKLIENIYELTRPQTKKNKKTGKDETVPAKINTIADVRDESDRTGMRIVIELKKNVNPEEVINYLYGATKLQINYGVNMLALVDGEPVVLNLMKILQHFIDFQKEIITNRTKYDLKKASDRLHILEGLAIALDNIDKVIEVIKKSESTSVAKTNLINTFNLSEIQAQAILDMRLQRLTGMEKDKIIAELNEILARVKYYKSILEDEKKLLAVIKEELLEVKASYGDERRTTLSDIEEATTTRRRIVEEIKNYNTVTYFTKEGYFKKVPAISLRGSAEFKLKDGDKVITELQGQNTDDILVFTNSGRIFRMKAHKVEDKKISDLGLYLPTELELEKNEKIINVITTGYKPDENVLVFYENGYIAKINIKSYNSSRSILTGNTNSKIIKVEKVTGNVNILLISNEGKALIFNTQNQINTVSSRTTVGVKSIKLKEGGKVVYGGINPKEGDIFNIMTDKGSNKVSLGDTMFYTGSKGIVGATLYNCKKNNEIILQIE